MEKKDKIINYWCNWWRNQTSLPLDKRPHFDDTIDMTIHRAVTHALEDQRESIVGELEKKHSFPVTGLMTPEEQQWNYGQSVGYNQAIQEAIKIVEGK